MRHLGTFIHAHPKIFGIMGYHTGIYCVLRLGSQPGATATIDEADDQAIERLVQKFGSFFPAVPPNNIGSAVAAGSLKQVAAGGIPAVQPTQLHTPDKRDTSYHGHSFDSFYHHCERTSEPYLLHPVIIRA